MVILPEWQRTAAAYLGRSGAEAEVMPGEDAGSGALASPPVGYLGKVSLSPLGCSALNLFCHLRKAELCLTTTVTSQCHSKLYPKD